jgi:hypothetical protein
MALHVQNGAAMIRASLFLGLAVSAILPACTTSSPSGDEFAGESSADGEGGKGDTSGVYTFFNLIPDTRACSLNSPADCGTGFFASRANRSSTTCTRGVTASQCKVQTIDWTPTAMPASVAKNYEDRLRGGEPLLVRGELVPAANDAGVSLAVDEIWVGSSPEWAEGVFALVHDNGVRCITAPCPSLTEKKLNSTLSAQLTGVDFEASGAPQEAIDIAQQAMYGDGVVVVGYRDYDSLGGKTRTANKFFTKAPVPLH